MTTDPLSQFSRRQSFKVSVADDQWVPKDELSHIISDAGWSVVQSTTKSKEVVEQGLALGARIFVLDIRFDGQISGIEAAQRILKTARETGRSRPQIVFVTALNDPDTIAAARELQPVAVLEKPAPEESVLQSVEIASKFLEFESCNNERWELIIKKHTTGKLSTPEEHRLAELNKLADDVVDSSFPLPTQQ